MGLFNTDVNCDITALSQYLSPILYPLLCGHSDAHAVVDLDAGEELKDLRVNVIRELNQSLELLEEVLL